MFCIRDAQIRLLLLDHFVHYMHCFNKDDLQLHILPEVSMNINMMYILIQNIAILILMISLLFKVAIVSIFSCQLTRLNFNINFIHIVIIHIYAD